jgi:hypothetical protein
MKAFPTVTGSTGMELRDYFAAKAMGSIISKYGDEPPYLDFMDDDEPAELAIALLAYHIADVMMKARETK